MKLCLLFLLTILFSSSVFSNEAVTLHCYKESITSPEVFEIYSSNNKIIYTESPGVKVNIQMDYKEKSNLIISNYSFLNFFDETFGNGEGLIIELENQVDVLSKTDSTGFSNEKLNYFKNTIEALNDAINYLQTAELTFSFNKELDNLEIDYSKEPKSYLELFGNLAPKTTNYYCLKAFIANPNQPQKWIGFVIKVNDMVYEGAEKRRRMIFPAEQTYTSEDHCYEDFGWIFKNDTQIVSRFPQNNDIDKSYLFGCVETK